MKLIPENSNITICVLLSVCLVWWLAPALADDTGITVLTTRHWSTDGKVPTGTIWREFETWRSDVARTDDGKLVDVDPLTPRAGRDKKGDIVRYNFNQPGWALNAFQFKTLELYPAKVVYGSDWPAANWHSPDFDDSTWVRDPFPQRELYGLVALRCLRGRFDVIDPAKVNDLTFTVRFSGGAVAYLNGKEIGRSGLAQGDIKPDTLADDYPKDAYIDSDGTLIQQPMDLVKPRLSDNEKRSQTPARNAEEGLTKYGGRWRAASVDDVNDGFFFSTDPQVAEKYKSRIRKLEVKIPPAMLVKGTNVLAIEIHRSAAWDGMFTSPSFYEGKKTLISLKPAEAWWDRSAVEDINLSAGAGSEVAPNVAPPKSFEIFNHQTMVDLDPSYYGDPNEKLQPVRLRGARNGSYSGELVAGSTTPIKGLAATVTDLKGPGGEIPASAITVGYPRVADGFQGDSTFDKNDNEWVMFDPIETSAPSEIDKIPWGYTRTFPPMQPIWLTIRVPRDAKPGLYQGMVTVNAEDEKTVTTPLTMEVIGDWVMPDPVDFNTYVGFMECPDAVAKYYGVPMWSEEHWKLLDKTFEVLGQIGTKEVWVPLVAKTHMGNPNSMVHWIKQSDGSYKADTSIAERYIDTAIKHLGKVPSVCLFIIQYNQLWGPNNTASDQPICTEADPKTGELKDFSPPKWGTPESIAFWKPVIDHLHEFLTSRGLKDSMMFGYLAQDMGPATPGKTMPSYFADLRQISPGTKWTVTTHVGPDSWRTGNLTGRDFLGSHSWMFATLENARWMDENDSSMWTPKYGWRDKSEPFYLLAASRSRSPTLDNDHCDEGSRLRVAPESVLMSQYGGYTWQGFGSWGADFWGNEWYSIAGGSGNAGRTFANCGLSESTVLWMVGPGKTGPVPTVRTRMMQEGLQEAQARIFVQNAVLDQADKLGPDLTKPARDLCDERTRMLTYISNFRYNDGEGTMPRERLIPDPAAWEDAQVKLLQIAAEIERHLRNDGQ